ncbi:MAG: Uma2 family endonuclease [Cyanobacteria bacterium J06628_6]
MTYTAPSSGPVIYPESDGKPLAESDPTRDYLLYSVEALRLYFRGRSNVYVSGNLFIYYEEGNPKAVLAPDVFVIFGVSNRKRRIYQSWKEGDKLPAFVLEVTSKTTRKQDQETKPQLYASLGVQEYFQYDPTADYLNPQLQADYLVDGNYQPQPLQYTADQIPYIHSRVLGLDLQLHTIRSTVLGLSPYLWRSGFTIRSRVKRCQAQKKWQKRWIWPSRNAMRPSRNAIRLSRNAMRPSRNAIRLSKNAMRRGSKRNGWQRDYVLWALTLSRFNRNGWA